MYLTPTDYNENLKILQNLKLKKSSGHDNITSELLKQLDTSVAYPISIITNKSITSATVPGFLSKVIPIYKSKSHLHLQIIGPYHCFQHCPKFLKTSYTRDYILF